MVELSVTDLSLNRWGQFLQKDLSFSAKGGEVIVIKGPNGTGKTSLLKVLADIHEPAKGKIHWQPKPKKIFLGHENALFPTLSIKANLRFWAPEKTREQVGKVLDFLNLEKVADELPSHLSAGQCRRASLARFLLQKADVWLMDEPYSHLDMMGQDLLWKMLQTHIHKGGMAVLVSHILVPFTPQKIVEFE